MDKTNLSLASNSTSTPGGIVESVLETGSGMAVDEDIVVVVEAAAEDEAEELLEDAGLASWPWRAVCMAGEGCGRKLDEFSKRDAPPRFCMPLLKACMLLFIYPMEFMPLMPPIPLMVFMPMFRLCMFAFMPVMPFMARLFGLLTRELDGMFRLLLLLELPLLALLVVVLLLLLLLPLLLLLLLLLEVLVFASFLALNCVIREAIWWRSMPLANIWLTMVRMSVLWRTDLFNDRMSSSNSMSWSFVEMVLCCCCSLAEPPEPSPAFVLSSLLFSSPLSSSPSPGTLSFISGGRITFAGRRSLLSFNTGLLKCTEFLRPSLESSILSFLRPSILSFERVVNAFRASSGERYSTKQKPLFLEALSIMHRTSTMGPEPQTTDLITSTSQLYGIAPT